MPNILKYTDYDSGLSSPLLLNDGAQDSGSIVIADFLDPYGFTGNTRVSRTMNPGETLRNFVNNNYELSLLSSLSGLSTRGIIFDQVASGQIALPSTCKLTPASTMSFGFGAWIYPHAMTAGANQYGSVMGYCINTNPANVQWLIQCSTQTDPTQYTLNVAGTGRALTVPANTLSQIFLWAQIAGGNVTVTAYQNGLLSGSSTGALPSGVLPAPSSSAVVGVAGGFGPWWKGEICRVLFQDFTVAGAKTPAQFVADDYALNAARFV